MADFDDAAVHIADAAWTQASVGKPQSHVSGAEGDDLPIKFWSDLDSVVPPDRLVRNTLGINSLVLVYGEPGSGKTFLVADLGMHIALGREWFGRDVTAGAVLYVACEGVAGLSNRLAAYRQRHDLTADVSFAVVPVAVDLGPDGQDAPRVIRAAETVKARYGLDVQLIIIDTLARAMGNGDENSARDMSVFIKACDRIRIESGAAVLIVHHSGKSKQSGARGSSALLGAVDTAIEVTNDEGARIGKVVKQKDGATGVELGFALQVVEVGRDEDDEMITTCIVDPGEVIRKPKGQQASALRVLQNVINELGEHWPESTVPAAKRITIGQFKAALKVEGVTSSDNPSTARKQWERISKGLTKNGLLFINGDFCWTA